MKNSTGKRPKPTINDFLAAATLTIVFMICFCVLWECYLRHFVIGVNESKPMPLPGDLFYIERPLTMHLFDDPVVHLYGAIQRFVYLSTASIIYLSIRKLLK